MKKKKKNLIALITQNRGLENILRRVSSHYRIPVDFYENCDDFIKNLMKGFSGIVIVDASVCIRESLMDIDMIINEADNWKVIYIPKTNKRSEIKNAISVGVFGCLHRPVKEKEVSQMIYSAMDI